MCFNSNAKMEFCEWTDDNKELSSDKRSLLPFLSKIAITHLLKSANLSSPSRQWCFQLYPWPQIGHIEEGSGIADETSILQRKSCFSTVSHQQCLWNDMSVSILRSLPQTFFNRRIWYQNVWLIWIIDWTPIFKVLYGFNFKSDFYPPRSRDIISKELRVRPDSNHLSHLLGLSPNVIYHPFVIGSAHNSLLCLVLGDRLRGEKDLCFRNPRQFIPDLEIYTATSNDEVGWIIAIWL